MWLSATGNGLCGPIDGVNVRFALTTPVSSDAIIYVNGLARPPLAVADNGYSWDGTTLVLGEPPVPGDTVAIWQPAAVGQATTITGPTPGAGIVTVLSPTIEGQIFRPQTSTWPPPGGSACVSGG